MDTTARRYTSPVTRPILVSRPSTASLINRDYPVLCLHCEPQPHNRRPLVGFAWGRVLGRR